MAISSMFGICPPPMADPQHEQARFEREYANSLYGRVRMASALGQANPFGQSDPYDRYNRMADFAADANAKQVAAEREAKVDERLLLLENE